MALATTTLSSKVLQADLAINVASNTSIAVGRVIHLNGEVMAVAQSWGSSTYPTSGTIVPVLRGINGTPISSAAHVSGSNVVHGLASDFPAPPVGVGESVTYPVQPNFPIIAYGAAGALTVGGAGLPGPAAIHEIVGTGALAMTLAAPDASMDGTFIWVVGNGKAAHTLAVSGNNGIGNAGAGYRTITFAAGAKLAFGFVAMNGDWVSLANPFGGTTTNLQGALS